MEWNLIQFLILLFYCLCSEKPSQTICSLLFVSIMKEVVWLELNLWKLLCKASCFSLSSDRSAFFFPS